MENDVFDYILYIYNTAADKEGWADIINKEQNDKEKKTQDLMNSASKKKKKFRKN